jgi:glycosyltransferase involved in cell wall biosynthesis
MGNLLHLKGFHLGLRAFAESGLSDIEYWILGDGPERGHLRLLAEELGISGRVKFWGRVPREEALRKLSECHILVHPSLHDSGGWVCLEAMAAGRPVICLDLGGPTMQVTEDAGIKVPPITPKQAVSDLAAAMRALSKDYDLLARMGEAGKRRVAENFGWREKGARIADLYQEMRTR